LVISGAGSADFGKHAKLGSKILQFKEAMISFQNLALDLVPDEI